MGPLFGKFYSPWTWPSFYGGLAFLDSDYKPGALMRSDPGPVDDDPVVEEIKDALKEDCNTLRYPCGKGK